MNAKHPVRNQPAHPRPGKTLCAVASLAALLAPAAFADPAPSHGIVASTIGVQQLGFENPPENVIVTNRYAIGDFQIRASANKGDYDVQIGEILSDDVEGGVLITSIAENGGRDNLDASGSPDPVYPGINTATAHIDYSRTGANAGGYFIPVAMTYPNSAATTVVEYNLNVAAAWFPRDKWLGAFVRNSGNTNGGQNNLISGSPGLVLGTHFIDHGGGRSTIDLSTLGINSQTDGIVLVTGAKNEDNYALSQANTNGAWTVYSKDNGTDGASLEQDPIAFVYIPKTNALVVSGRFNGDASVSIAGGNFTVTYLEEGRWELKIPGRNPDNGVLMVSPEGGLPLNRDNIVSAAPNPAGDGWIIESRDLPNSIPPGETMPILETPGVEPVASFLFIPGATAGVTVTPTNNVFTTEGGGTGSFAVALDTKPKADVTIALNSSNPAEGSAAPAALAFTPDNWNIQQTVTVTGQDDTATDGPASFTIVLAAAVSADPEYSGLNPADVAIVNLDNDGTFTVNPTAGLVVSEAGGAATFTVHLDVLPASPVVIALASSDPSEGTVEPAALTFTPENWNQAQTVTIAGVNDAIDDGDMAFAIITAPAVSADPFFSAKVPPDVAVLNTDDDTAGVQIAPASGLTVVEAGGATAYTVVLASEPANNVMVAPLPSDPGELAANPALLTFTPANWSTPQTVTLTGADDLVVDGNVAVNVTNSVTSADPLYAAIKPITVSAIVLDNEAVLALPGEGIIYGAGMPAIAIAGRLSLVDSNTPSYNGAALSIALASASPDDRLEIRNDGAGEGQIGVNGTNITFAGTVIGHFTGGADSTPLSIAFNEAATPSAAESLLRAVTFRNLLPDPAAGVRELAIRLTDADGGVSSVVTTIRVGLLRRADFQEGADHGYGVYTGAADIELYELQPDSPKPAGRGASGLFIDWRDADTPNAGQILLRFSNMIGNGPGQVPTNAIVVSAELFLDINDTGDASPLYRMLVPWDPENETWNSIGGGITPDDIKARAQYESQIGVENGTGATTVGTVWVSVTPDVQAWVRGETNHGWVMPAWPLNLDGTGFSPSEAPNVTDRPRLRVLWLPANSVSESSFRQDVSNYTGAVDTRIRQNAPDTDFGAATTLFADAIVSGSDPNPEQVLLRFDEIIGTNANQIPPGSRIEAAILDLASVNGDAMGDGGTFHALLQAWPELATWNGFVDGVQTNGIEAAAAPSAIAGYPELNPDVQGGFLSFDLTADVQAWAAGARMNAGWMINPWAGGGNGWGFNTSENATEQNRPRLRVFHRAGVVVTTIVLAQPVVTAENITLRFAASPGAAYSIHRSERVDTGWTKVGDATTDATGQGAFTDAAPPASRAFYRVSTP